MRRTHALLVIALGTVALLAACGAGDTPGSDGGEGTFAGAVTIGPLCPVEPCEGPAGSPYHGSELVLMQPGGVRISVPLEDDGTFSAVVPSGSYDVHLTPCNYLSCSSVFPIVVSVAAGETTEHRIDVDTGIRSPGGAGIAALVERLRDAGADVELGGAVSQPFFAVPGQILAVNGADVQVYAYLSVEMAEADAASVSPDGSTIGLTSVLWTSPPHYFRDAELLALYVGADDAVVGLLTTVLGRRFAGGATVPVPDVPEVPEAADAAARAALAERLGVPPDSLLLVRAAEVTFSNGALGCPQPGVAYTQALVPGFELLYEHGRVRYQYHVSEDGAQLTDCRGEGAEALPFRVGRGVVTASDPFVLAERQGPLAAEVVLRTAEEAAAYVASHPGAVSIDTAAVDWSTQLVAGAVVTGTGCTFVAEVTGVRADHLSRAVDVAVHAEVTGLCEKLGALALWVILDDVSDDYRMGFTLSSFGP